MLKAFIMSTVFVLVIVFGFSALTFVAFPLRYKDHIIAASQETEIDPTLIASIIRAESNFKSDAVSSKGAVGLMQLLPSTAEYVAKMNGVDEFDLLNPSDNIRLGALYMRYLLDKFKDERIAVMAYNAGEGNVKKWLDNLDEGEMLSTTPFKETNAYVDRVFTAMNFYKWRF